MKMQVRNRNHHETLISHGFVEVQPNVFEIEVRNARATMPIEDALVESGLILSMWMPYGCPKDTIVLSTPEDQDIEFQEEEEEEEEIPEPKPEVYEFKVEIIQETETEIIAKNIGFCASAKARCPFHFDKEEIFAMKQEDDTDYLYIPREIIIINHPWFGQGSTLYVADVEQWYGAKLRRVA